MEFINFLKLWKSISYTLIQCQKTKSIWKTHQTRITHDKIYIRSLFPVEPKKKILFIHISYKFFLNFSYFNFLSHFPAYTSYIHLSIYICNNVTEIYIYIFLSLPTFSSFTILKRRYWYYELKNVCLYVHEIVLKFK